MNPPREPAARGSNDSPCVKVCVLHPDGSHCVGCFRTTSEIARWGAMTTSQRAQVWALLDERRATRREELRALRRARRNHA